MNLKILARSAAVLISMLLVRPLGAEESRAPADTVTADEVLAAMARVPEREVAQSDREPPPGHYDRLADAQEIAHAIAAAVNGTEPLYQSRAVTAALLAVHGAWESNNHRCARGDSGRSWGFLQLSIAHTDRYQACDPALAARKWLRLAKAVWCSKNPEGAELAAVDSGRCDAAWNKARHRLAVARQIADDVAHSTLARE
jgi:hypothetical protein